MEFPQEMRNVDLEGDSVLLNELLPHSNYSEEAVYSETLVENDLSKQHLLFVDCALLLQEVMH